MNKTSKILIIGHDDIIERSLYEYLKAGSYSNVTSSSLIALNPTIQASIYEYFQKNRPEYVFLTSTRSGGIEANIKNPGEFIYHNLESQSNVVYASHKFGVKKLLFVAASCVYPNSCPQPMKEEYLLTGELEKTSESYSIAKIAGIKLCQAYKKQYGLNAISMVPATIYGPGSDTDLDTSHVLGALLGKFTNAVKNNDKEVVVWGSGTPKREFLYVEDFVNAALFLMEKYDDSEIINAGSGSDISIKDLAQTIAEVVGFKGKITFDSSKPDGAKQKLLDSSRITSLGWKPKVSLKEGIEKTNQSIKGGIK